MRTRHPDPLWSGVAPVRRGVARLKGPRAIWALVAALFLLLLAPGAAGAHGGAGEITVDSVDIDGLSVRIVVSISHVIDGHPAQPATFVLDATATGGSTGVTEIPLSPTGTEGTYQAVFDLPGAGDYLLTLTSTLPPATLEQTVTVEAPATSDAPTTASQPPDSAGPGASDTAVTASVVDQDESEAGPPVYLLAGLACSFAALAVGAVLVVRSRRRG